jgi:prephenate dehydrogenase (NADP+)
VTFGNFQAYQDRFEAIQKFFAPRFPEAVALGNEMIKEIMTKTKR